LGVPAKMVDFMKKKTIHSGMFKDLCVNVDTPHINLMLHKGIRWLSRGRVLNRVFELKDVLQDYFQENCMPEFANFRISESTTSSRWIRSLEEC
jgi:hypothetical protein